MNIRMLADARNTLGEGPVWDDRANVLYWVDNLDPAVWRYDPATGESRNWKMPEEIGCLALRESQPGIVAAMKSGFSFVDLDTGRIELVASPEQGIAINRLNDGRCDRRGRFWCGSMNVRGPYHPNREKSAALYRLDPDLSCHRMDEGFIVSNGIAFSPDDKLMYFSDTPSLNVYVYDFDIESGAISNRRIFTSTAGLPGRVDGAAVDVDGGYWCAHVNGGAVVRYGSDGQITRRIDMPTRDVTCVAWGGKDLDVLYVTSANKFLLHEGADSTHAGALWEIRGIGTRGLPEPRFRG
jgi:sugar lactone lactonase YvrE